jgi:hypothetical protein
MGDCARIADATATLPSAHGASAKPSAAPATSCKTGERCANAIAGIVAVKTPASAADGASVVRSPSSGAWACECGAGQRRIAETTQAAIQRASATCGPNTAAQANVAGIDLAPGPQAHPHPANATSGGAKRPRSGARTAVAAVYGSNSNSTPAADATTMRVVSGATATQAANAATYIAGRTRLDTTLYADI